MHQKGAGVSGEIFIDWLTASEHHPGGSLPIVCAGLDVRYDRDGLPRRERTIPAGLAGSFASSVQVGCDGARVYMSGNVGRFSRQDNLFNYGWPGTFAAANRILLGVGLPAFTTTRGVSENGAALGGRISRLDITSNFCTGSEGQARAVIRWLGNQAVARVRRGMDNDGSVWWGNTRHMFKAYLKGREMMAHGKSPDEFVVDWCQRNGVLRVEVELRGRLLGEFGLRHFADVTDERLAEVYREQTSVLRRVDRSNEPDIVAGIPCRSRGYATAWLAGKDVRLLGSRATLFRHARVLREYGIDILSPRANVAAFPIQVRVVDLVPAAMPDWYELKVA